jgi:uncharacterized membrane protein
LAAVVVVLVVPENDFPGVYLRYAMSVVSVLFLPGYAIIRALYPFEIPVKTGDGFTDNMERVALSLAVSIAIVPIVAVLLNFTPWGIRLAPVSFSVLALTAVAASVGAFRSYQHKSYSENSGPTNA